MEKAVPSKLSKSWCTQELDPTINELLYSKAEKVDNLIKDAMLWWS